MKKLNYSLRLALSVSLLSLLLLASIVYFQQWKTEMQLAHIFLEEFRCSGHYLYVHLLMLLIANQQISDPINQ